MLTLLYLAGVAVALLGIATSAWVWVTVGALLAIFLSVVWTTK